MEENNKYNPNQYGFRKGRGTATALALLYETIAISQHHKWRCNVVCRDVAKAFDKVWHLGLQYKILQQGLPVIYEKILSNYSTNRKAIVRYNNSYSEPIEIESGVPQGGILSPTLYILFTADSPPPGPGALDVEFADYN